MCSVAKNPPPTHQESPKPIPTLPLSLSKWSFLGSGGLKHTFYAYSEKASDPYPPPFPQIPIHRLPIIPFPPIGTPIQHDKQTFMGRVPHRTHHSIISSFFSLSLRLSVNRADFPRISPPQREPCTMTPVSATIPVPLMSVRKLPVYQALSCTQNVVILSSVTGGLLLRGKRVTGEVFFSSAVLPGGRFKCIESLSMKKRFFF